MESTTARAARTRAARSGGHDPENAGRRQRLLAAGLEVFSESSYDEVLVSAIAQKAGVAAGLPYHYFGSKRGLYLAVLGYVVAELRQAYETPASMAPHDSVRALLTANLHWLAEHRRVLSDLLRGGLGADPQLREVFDAARWDGAAQLLQLIGCPEPDPVTRIFIEGWIAMKDEVTLAWLDRAEADEDRLIEVLVQLLADVLERASAITGFEVPGLSAVR